MSYNYSTGAEPPLDVGNYVQVVSKDSGFYGCKGLVVDRSRTGGWGRLVVRIEKDGRVYEPEIKRGHLERVPPGSEAKP